MTYQGNGAVALQDGGGDLQNGTQTCGTIDTTVTRPRSRPVRYRLTDGDGKSYSPFRLRPGVTLPQIAANTPGSKGGWTIEVVGVE